ncbi:unnamed protein product [Cylindrotheca closterium]|uniref:RING-type domain-containing protein n=1 Tax=Cylindrotheca closterium TaxID=2856 RepID=A0AAD2JMS3_9STRA|nr:unnamed protein product [Cylindrotheca closterium]
MMLKGKLDDQFFDIADRVPGSCDDSEDETAMQEYYGCVFPHSTMVLYSRRTGAPLAALTLATSDSNCQSMITRRPAPPEGSEAYFQGMLDKEGAFFEFTISNLSYRGSINFNILHTPYRVSATNQGPSFGMNEVNELSPNQSYTVRANQQNNRRMCLRGKTKTIQDHHSTVQCPMSVTEAESDTSQQGLYFCLSVAPEASCPALVVLFSEGTVWKVADGFTREVPIPKTRRSYRSCLPISPKRPLESGSLSDWSINTTRASDSAAFSISSRQRRSKCPLERASMKSIGIDNTVIPIPRPERRSMTYVDDHLFDNPSRSSFSRASMTSIDIGDMFASQQSPRQRQQRRNTTMQIPIDIGHTQAADLDYGEEIQIRSEGSSLVFDFDKASDPTVLCMSIWKEMSQHLLVNDDRHGSPRRVNSRESPGNLEQSRNCPALQSFEDEAIEYQLNICMADVMSPVDTILIPCGHQCFHSGNLNHHNITHCPQCRTQISAIMPLSMTC